ncbi:MAG: sulfotransferase family protein [Candidatus Binatia bacterium]
MKTPDFFIVGAPKCGTTAMNHYLKQHPDIFVSEKEIHFFGSDLSFTYPRVTKAEYLSFFSPAASAKRVGEAAVWYLYSEHAAAEIKEFCPSARIIVMLRNPVDAMHSLYCQRLYNGNEDIEDFEAALAAEQDRKCGLSLPKRASNLMGCFYRDTVKFTRQVRRYFENFGRDNVHVIIFEDLQKDVAGVYKHCCEFLGVDHRFRPDFPVINARPRARSTLLRDLLHHPPRSFDWLAGALMLRQNRQGGYKGWLKRLNTSHARIPAMKAELRRRLQEDFSPEVQELSNLLGRDLTYWCNR